MAPPAKSPGLARIPPIRLFAFAFLNLGRHGLRAAVNVVGIAIAVASLIFFLAFFRGTYDGAMFSSVIDFATAQGQLMRPSFDEEETDGWLSKENLLPEEMLYSPELASALKQTANAEASLLTRRLLAPAFAGDGSRKAAVVLAGVDFAGEGRVFALDERIKSGSFGPGGVVIGKKLASILSLGEGDEIRLQATTALGTPNLDYWPVVGIYSTGYPPLDRAMVLMELPKAQAFLGAEGSVNKLYCRLSEASSGERDRWISTMTDPAARPRFEELGLSFKSWKDYAKGIVEDAQSDGFFYSIFIGILLFLSLSTLAGTMRVTVFERKREIGMLRASGWLRGEIGTLFLFEAMLLGIAGSLFGGLVGGAAALALHANPIGFGDSFASLDIPSFSLTCELSAPDLLWSLLAGFLTSLFAGILPARAAARMPILSALSER